MMITRILRIADHPMAAHPDKLRENYVRGLGCVLHAVSNGHPNMRLLFEQWGYSILNRNVAQYFQSENCSYIGRALALNRHGLRFFRVKRQFYFDCFYLTEAFERSLLSSLNRFLTKNGVNVFTKSALIQTDNYFFSGNAGLRVEESLLRHRENNHMFESEYENRILVVATVSAGKSTLINALTGHFFNKARPGVCTTRVCRIHNKCVADGITLKQGDSYVYANLSDDRSSDDAPEVGLHFNSALGSRRVCIIDTPGVNNAGDSEHYRITSQEIKSQRYDCVIFISNGQYNGTTDEYRILCQLHEQVKKPIIFVLNQLDRFNSRRDDIAKMVGDYRQELVSIGFKSPKIYPLSAQYALLLRNEEKLDEDEKYELDMMKTRFANTFFDLQHYAGEHATNELEKSGIILLEKEITKHLRQ